MTQGRAVSVNVGRPRIVLWKGIQVSTAIFKAGVEGPVEVKKLNLRGDQQSDLSVHGGTHKAVYAYPAEHYPGWQAELPETKFPWGAFGENLTTEGLSETDLHIGDRVRVGSVLLMVTQPRMPCYKLTIRFNRDDMIKRFLASHTSGFYFSVLEEGELAAGSSIDVEHRDPAAVSVADINSILYTPGDTELLRRAVAVHALPEELRQHFLQGIR